MQILNIHTSKLRKEDKLSEDVSLDILAGETKNFSGAEIEGLVRAAATTCCLSWVDHSIQAIQNFSNQRKTTTPTEQSTS